MARSAYVYVVEQWVPAFGGGDYQLLGAFTVKHEMVTAVGQEVRDLPIEPDHLRIWRVVDGRVPRHGERVNITDQFTWSKS